MQFFTTAISAFPIAIFLPFSKFLLPTPHQVFQNYKITKFYKITIFT